MTEHVIPGVGLTNVHLREEPHETTVEGWQWSGDDHDSVVVSLLGDGSVEIETVDGPGVPQHHYMRHPTPERLDPDPERLEYIHGFVGGIDPTSEPWRDAKDLAAKYKTDVRWLLHELDKAVARDRQPHPSRQAYERTSEVLHFYRAKVVRVREYLFNCKSQPTITELREVLDGDGVNPPPGEHSMSPVPTTESATTTEENA